MTPDAYDLLKQGLFLWQQNALNNNDAATIKKDQFSMRLQVLTPEGYYDVKDVHYDMETNSIVLDASIEPYTAR